MTASAPAISWDPPAPGAFIRTYRFGEWLGEPVTPLFESWLLTAMEERLHVHLFEELGQRAPRPYHVVVNGWYFYSMNWASSRWMLRNLPRMLAKALRTPRAVAGILPATVRHSVALSEREWRDETQPRYRAAVGAAEARVESMSVDELPALIDDLGALAGDYFTSIAKLTGAAYKLELNLAAFHRKHLRKAVGWSHLPLVAGFEPPSVADQPAVTSLDWIHEPRPVGDPDGAARAVDPEVVAARHAAEAASFAALAGSPRRLQTFQRLLVEAQRLIAIREEQTRELTLPWPVLRRAVMRLGEALVEIGQIERTDDIFFLTRAEVLDALAGRFTPAIDVDARRGRRAAQATLAVPLWIGKLPALSALMWKDAMTKIGARPSDRAIVSGAPASAGRATGLVRVVRGPDDFDDLVVGEVLVAPLTAPAWTPLFLRAAAVVTDVGGVTAHASIIAREFGIPAIVGTGDGTSRLRTGMRVTVDGGTGVVEAAEA